MRVDIPYDIKDKVTVDGDVSIVAVITAFTITLSNTQAKLEWVHCGDQRSAWIDLWRLSLWEG